MRLRALLTISFLILLTGRAFAAGDWSEVMMGASDRMDVCLTLDAGGFEGGDRTDAILDIMEARGITCTTFMTGRMITNFPTQVNRMVRDGYEFGNHTDSHPDFTAKTNGNYTYSEDTLINDEIGLTETMVRGVYNGRTTRPWFRFPYGARDARAFSIIRKAGLRSVYWSTSAEDSNSDTYDGAYIKEKTLASTRPGAIILLHWAGYHTYEVMAEILDTLKARGYNFVTLSELMVPGPTMGTVVDDKDNGFTTTGSWQSSYNMRDRYMGTYCYAAASSSATATFTATLTPGQYDVYAWWAVDTATDRCSNVGYTVKHSTGSATVRVNQKTNGGKWNLLGTYTFGTAAAQVTLSTSGASGTNVIADAVRFAPKLNPAALTPTWTYPATGAIGAVYSSPAVYGDLTVIGSDDGYLYGLNTFSGAQRWKTSIGAQIRTRPQFYGTALYVTTVTGQLLSINPTTGAIVWRTPVATGALSSPTPTSSWIYVGASDGRVYRVAAATGQLGSYSPSAGGAIVSSPSVPGTDLVWYGTTSGKLFCLNGDLSTIRWNLPAGRKPINAAPYVSTNGNWLVVPTASETLMMVNSTNGSPACPVYTGTPALNTDAVLIGGPSNSSAWVNAVDKVAYFGTTRHTIWGVDLTTSLPAVGWPLKPPGTGDFASSPLVVAGASGKKVLYIGCADGKFYAVPVNDTIHYSQFTGPTGEFAASPAASGQGAGQIVVTATTAGKVYGFPLQ